MSSGGHVVVAEADAPGLSVRRCVALGATPGVIASAALEPGDLVQLETAPGILFQTGSITGAASVFAPDRSVLAGSDQRGWVLGSAVASEIGAKAGTWLSIVGPNYPVATVLDTELRNPIVARWIMSITAPAGSATQCWIEFSPGAITGRLELVATTFAEEGDRLRVRDLIRLDEFSRDPAIELATRPHARAWWLAASLLSAIMWLTVWMRRAEVGLYRAVGTNAVQLMILGTVETLITLSVGAIAGFLWGSAIWTALRGYNPIADQFYVSACTASSVSLLAILIAPWLWPVLARGSIPRQLKEA